MEKKMEKETKKTEELNTNNTCIERREFLQKMLKLSMAAAVALTNIVSPDIANAYKNSRDNMFCYKKRKRRYNQIGSNNVCYNNVGYTCYARCHTQCHTQCHKRKSPCFSGGGTCYNLGYDPG